MTRKPRPPHPQLAEILALSDQQTPVDQLATAYDLSPSQVYTILREHRPDRARKARRRSSEKRDMILGLSAKGHEPERVAFLAGCSKAWVYRILAGQ